MGWPSLRHFPPRRVAHLSSILVMAVGALVLLGWQFRIDALQRVWPGLVSMKANTAVGLLLAGLALWLLLPEQIGLKRKGLAQVCALSVAGIGLLTVAEYAYGVDLKIDQLLFTEPPGDAGTAVPGRMGLNTAINFALLGPALLAFSFSTPRSVYTSQVLTGGAALISLVAFVGYAYSVTSLYGMAAYTQMALHTTLAFIALCAGILFARPGIGVMAPVTSESAGGIMARRLLPAAVLIPAVMGWVRLAWEQTGLYDPHLGLFSIVVATMAGVAVFIWWTARSLNDLDARRGEAEHRLHEALDHVEHLLQAQTAQLEESKRIQRTLRESQAKYRDLYDNAPGMLASIDAGTSCILQCNKALAAATGYAVEELIGRRMFDLYHADSREAVAAAFRAFTTKGEVGEVELEFRRKDGSKFPVSMRVSAVRDEDGTVLFSQCVWFDLTERKRAEQLLARHQETLELAQASGKIGTFEWNIRTGEVTWNAAEEELYGLPPGGFGGKYGTWLGTVHPDDRAAADEAVRLSVAMRHELNMEFRIIRPDGRTRWISAKGKVQYDQQGSALRMVGINMDITERKESEQRLKQQNERLVILSTVAERLLSSTDPDAMVKDLFETVSRHLGLDAYFNFMINESGNGLTLESYGGIPEETARQIARLEFGQEICGTVALDRRQIVATSIQESEDPKVQLVKGFGIRAYACNPLMIGDRLLGTLSFATRSRDGFTADELEFLQVICHYVALAKEKLGLTRKLQEDLKRLKS
jgi:PAS domain S-box-containing protein